MHREEMCRKIRNYRTEKQRTLIYWLFSDETEGGFCFGVEISCPETGRCMRSRLRTGYRWEAERWLDQLATDFAGPSDGLNDCRKLPPPAG